MRYINTMRRILQFEVVVYQEMKTDPFLARYGFTNIIFSGLLYSFFSLLFNRTLFNVFTQPSDIILTQILVIISGIVVVFFFHLGISFLFWAFSRFVGSRPTFKLIYHTLGLVLVSLWFAVPGLTAIQAGITGYGIYVYTILTAFFALVVSFLAMKSVADLSNFKASIVMVITLVYIFSFLYLWI